MPDLMTALAVLIFLATYTVVALGKIPLYRIDRAGAALLGGSLMVAVGVLSLDDAYRAIDLNTITLLLGMMIVVANLRVSGFFRLVNGWIVTHVRHPLGLLTAVVLASGLLSAFLVNDTICLVLTPLVLDVVARLKRNPLPYLLAIAMSSNIGSVATITGNPQNIIIGSLSGIPYSTFTATLALVAAFGLVVTWLLIAAVYRREFFNGASLPQETVEAQVHKPLMIKCVLVVAVMIALFFLGQPVAKVAIVGGAFLLLTRRVSPHKIYQEIDWPLLVMFVGLFVVVAGLEKTAIAPNLPALLGSLHLDNVVWLGTATAVLSNIVSNVPAVLVLKPFIVELQDPQRAWLIVAMTSTLAGNFTLVGSVANLIVAQRAKARGVELDFWSYFVIGAPLTIITIAAGLFWLM
ncbi:anion transporter [Pseudolabrys taiwanensis]|uniref:Anion transporter n=1 Tax=Pseudolabrys taiwanensis TaxID=331696 RepID=A0A346A2A0_9HYPH|nr:anion transporter [Pseudolabrys taiwanensis]AXK83297.1 anion transporter [Pseudolabrys taiwanensis]